MGIWDDKYNKESLEQYLEDNRHTLTREEIDNIERTLAEIERQIKEKKLNAVLDITKDGAA